VLARWLKIIAVNALVLAAVLIGLEGLLRWLVSYSIGYYVGAPGAGRHVRPYGDLLVNRLGHPDVEFNLDDPRPRVGWQGDSVVAGIGAGFGHRFSDILRERHPGYQHMALGGIGHLGVQDPRATAAALEPLGLDRLVYVMNLNDVLPDLAQPSGGTVPAGTAQVPTEPGLVFRASRFVRDHLDGLRGRSYLYNWLRTQGKLALTRLGYEYHGMPAFELFPEGNAAVFDATCRRVQAFAALVAQRGTRFEVVLLPYEMQISEAAARRYAELGIRWEPGFETGSAQARLASCLGWIPVHDARLAFPPRDRNGLGEYFVYNQGDKLDWNHPNRAGHARLADFLDARLPWLARAGPPGVRAAAAPGGR
jgi:hypothetical protein